MQAAVLEDHAVAKVRREIDAGASDEQREFMTHCDKKYNSSFPPFKAF